MKLQRVIYVIKWKGKLIISKLIRFCHMHQLEKVIWVYVYSMCEAAVWSTLHVVVVCACRESTERVQRTVITIPLRFCCERNRNKITLWTTRRCFCKIIQFSWDHRPNRLSFLLGKRILKKALKTLEKIDVCYLRLWGKIPIKWLINKNKTVSKRMDLSRNQYWRIFLDEHQHFYGLLLRVLCKWIIVSEWFEGEIFTVFKI